MPFIEQEASLRYEEINGKRVPIITPQSEVTLTNTVNSELYGLSNLNFFDFNDSTKISLIIFMIFGKIEIVAILYLIKRLFFK